MLWARRSAALRFMTSSSESQSQLLSLPRLQDCLPGHTYVAHSSGPWWLDENANFRFLPHTSYIANARYKLRSQPGESPSADSDGYSVRSTSIQIAMSYAGVGMPVIQMSDNCIGKETSRLTLKVSSMNYEASAPALTEQSLLCRGLHVIAVQHRRRECWRWRRTGTS